MGDSFQRNLFLGTLRGPLCVDQFSPSQPRMYFKRTEKCSRCLKPKRVNFQSVNIGESLEESKPNRSFNVAKYLVSDVQKMTNVQDVQEKEKIYNNNRLLGFRMKHSYRPRRNTAPKLHLEQEEQQSVDNSLAHSAVSYIGTSKHDRYQKEWDEFKKTNPFEAMIVENVGTKKQKSKYHMTTEKTQMKARRQSQFSSFTQNNITQLFDQGGDQMIEQDEVILIENTKDQPDYVLKYLLGNQKFYSGEHELLQKWIFTLPQETRIEIEKDKKFFPIPRNIDQASITQGLDKLYGVGKGRRLRPGEEAILMETIDRFLKECYQNPQLITYSINYILNNQILKLAGMEDLNDFNLCMKQLECHWKIQATRFRYSGNPIIKSKNFEKFIHMAHARGHFLDLNKKDNLLVQYLLKHQQF